MLAIGQIAITLTGLSGVVGILDGGLDSRRCHGGHLRHLGQVHSLPQRHICCQLSFRLRGVFKASDVREAPRRLSPF